MAHYDKQREEQARREKIWECNRLSELLQTRKDQEVIEMIRDINKDLMIIRVEIKETWKLLEELNNAYVK